MNDASPSIIDTLIDNAKYIPDPEAAGEGGTSACEVKCREQQAALVSCMESIRQQNEDSTSTTKSKCLAPAVSSWTECCAKANNEDS